MKALLQALVICAPLFVPLGHCKAEDSAPAASAQSGQKDYERAISSEARDSRVSGVAAEQDTGTALADSPATEAAANRSRLDQIKAAVDDVYGVETSEPPPVENRRQKLREVVISSPEPNELQGDEYLEDLRDEVSKTIVVEGATEEAPSAPDAGKAKRPAEPATVDPKRTDYRVRQGDSLWKIAQNFLGDGHKWKLIYQANRDALKNAEVLLVGQKLKIPDRWP